jgi:hypothetical protein
MGGECAAGEYSVFGGVHITPPGAANAGALRPTQL